MDINDFHKHTIDHIFHEFEKNASSIDDKTMEFVKKHSGKWFIPMVIERMDTEVTYSQNSELYEKLLNILIKHEVLSFNDYLMKTNKIHPFVKVDELDHNMINYILSNKNIEANERVKIFDLLSTKQIDQIFEEGDPVSEFYYPMVKASYNKEKLLSSLKVKKQYVNENFVNYVYRQFPKETLDYIVSRNITTNYVFSKEKQLIDSPNIIEMIHFISDKTQLDKIYENYKFNKDVLTKISDKKTEWSASQILHMLSFKDDVINNNLSKNKAIYNYDNITKEIIMEIKDEYLIEISGNHRSLNDENINLLINRMIEYRIKNPFNHELYNLLRSMEALYKIDVISLDNIRKMYNIDETFYYIVLPYPHLKAEDLWIMEKKLQEKPQNRVSQQLQEMIKSNHKYKGVAIGISDILKNT